MVRKRERKPHLRNHLEYNRPAGERGGDAGALEMPAEDGRGEVRDSKEVHDAREVDAGDAVEAGPVPGYLWAVDGQVRGDGAVAALGGEDGVCGGFGDGFGGCGSDEVGMC